MRHLAASGACVVAIVATFWNWASGARLVTAAEAFSERYGVAARHPDAVQRLASSEEADFLLYAVADSVARDASTAVDLSAAPPDLQLAWVRALEQAGEASREAQALMLTAISRRPGWAYHQILLGRLVFHQHARTLSSALVEQHEKWLVPLSMGAQRVGSDPSPWELLALAYVSIWSDLGPRLDPPVDVVLRRAFTSTEFVRTFFTSAARAVGFRQAIDCLPDEFASLSAALRQLPVTAEPDAAWSLVRRWEAAAWKARTADLAAVENARARGDAVADGLCRRWPEVHWPFAFDTPAARSQLVRLLALWPDEPGVWETDGRRDVVRFFLTGRTGSIDSAVLERAIRSLAQTPPDIRALVTDWRGQRRRTCSGPAIVISQPGHETPFCGDTARQVVTTFPDARPRVVEVRVAGARTITKLVHDRTIVAVPPPLTGEQTFFFRVIAGGAEPRAIQ